MFNYVPIDRNEPALAQARPIYWLAADKPCPQCGAPAGHHCVITAVAGSIGNRMSDHHEARMKLVRESGQR